MNRSMSVISLAAITLCAAACASADESAAEPSSAAETVADAARQDAIAALKRPCNLSKTAAERIECTTLALTDVAKSLGLPAFDSILQANAKLCKSVKDSKKYSSADCENFLDEAVVARLLDVLRPDIHVPGGKEREIDRITGFYESDKSGTGLRWKARCADESPTTMYKTCVDGIRTRTHEYFADSKTRSAFATEAHAFCQGVFKVAIAAPKERSARDPQTTEQEGAVCEMRLYEAALLGAGVY